MLESDTNQLARTPQREAPTRRDQGQSTRNSIKIRRCAVYTRKSSDEGLEQSFNSLDAQREACEAYIASQKHEGWRLVETGYDDGGLSGGTMNRPALQRLLADITADRVDVVVVYKVDRLTRSLADFAKLTDLLDGAGASFVSVTQAFNTSTSMGRLTLNVLLSFAQFEREVAGERIRDKIAASKKRGMWMGGMPPLGYDVVDKQLVVNEAELKTVQTIFESYLKVGTVAKLKAAMDARGVVSKVRTIKGEQVGGKPITRNGYHTILKCPLYRGMIHHKGKLFPGNHEAIIGQELWDAVQEQLASNRAGSARQWHSSHEAEPKWVDATGKCSSAAASGPASTHATNAGVRPTHALTGILFDDEGKRLSPTHSTKRMKAGGVRRYTYYVSASLVRGQAKTGLRLSAPELDAMVRDTLRSKLADEGWVAGLIEPSTPLAERKAIIRSAADVAAQLSANQAANLLRRITIHPDTVYLHLDAVALAKALGTDPVQLTLDAIAITRPTQIVQRGKSTKLVIGSVDVNEPCINQELVDQLRLAHRWWQKLVTGSATSISSLAKAERVDASEVSRTITLAFLDPKIVGAILQGTQPPSLTLDALRHARPLPASWDEQRALLLP